MNDLIKQYDSLSDEEKRLLLIYKSQLFYFINGIDNINNGNVEKYIARFEKFKRIIELPENVFIKMSVFADVSIDSFDNFLKSINVIRQKIKDLYGKIILPSDMILFRCKSIKEKSNINKICIGDFISTSCNFETAENFFSYEGTNVTYVLKVKTGTPVLIIPYSIKLVMKDNKKILKIVANDDQNEIILFKDNIKIDIEKQDEENGEIFIFIDVNIFDKNKSNFKSP